MDNEILAANLKRLRAAKKMSQPALAEASGVSLPSIKNIERAKSTPRANTLMQLTKALGVRFQDLFTPIRTLHSVRFRAKKKISGRENILSNVVRWLDDFNKLEKILSDYEPFLFLDLRLSSFDNTNPVTMANHARSILNLKPDEPIHDICGLLEHAGVKLLSYSYSSDAFFGLSVGPDDQGPAIIVNTWDRISTERQIFSAAHELGHLLMHLSAYSHEKKDEDKQQEQEADLFAGYFLMPDVGFKKEWSETAGIPFVDRIMKIKRIFKVSYKTVLYRLTEMGVVDKSIWMRFNTAYERRYKRKLSYKEEPFSEGAEPWGMQSFDFYEDRLSRLARFAVEQEKVSISRGAEILRIPVEEMMDRLSEWEDFA